MTPMIVRTLIATLLLFPASLNAYKSNSNSGENYAQSTQSPAAPAPPLTSNNPTATTSTPNPGGNTQQSGQLWPKFLERLIDPVTWFTGFLVLVSVLQWLAMRRQADLMNDQFIIAKDAADAAQKSADAAVSATSALKVIHRQWVNVGGWTCYIHRSGHVNQIWIATATISITNASPLPLTILTVRCQFNNAKGTHEWSNNFLEPNGTRTESVAHILSDEETKRYGQHGTLSLAISGWVHFYDAFGDLQRQEIGTYCYIGGPEDEPTFSGLAGLKANLDKLAKEWPLDLRGNNTE